MCKQHPQKLNLQNLYTRRISDSNYGGITLTHKNLSPRKFNPQNIVSEKISTFTVVEIYAQNSISKTDPDAGF